MARDEARHARMQPQPARRVAIVLEPLARPELGAIHVDDALFAIGRAEAPFCAYPPETVADLSRRHARIFVEAGAAYLAELGSKNGTTVNGTPVRQAIVPLRDGDEIGFGRALSYRVQMVAVDSGPAPPARLAGLALQPESDDAGLEPIVITRFPFLVSKVDETFARYRNAQPHQVGYLSRRHAHIFLKGGRPYVEDLGSTNGTCIGAVRLDEHAHELKEGDVLAFGGRHFAYRVSLQWEPATQPEPTVTGVEAPPAHPAPADKTTFVAAFAWTAPPRPKTKSTMLRARRKRLMAATVARAPCHVASSPGSPRDCWRHSGPPATPTSHACGAGCWRWAPSRR
jgi:hypothetical protein